MVLAVARLLLHGKTCFHFLLRQVKTEISKEAQSEFSYRYRQNISGLISWIRVTSSPERNNTL